MSKTATTRADELHRAVEELPFATRVAMLDAVRSPVTRLIAGAYVAPRGGVCPLLAAHRRGGRDQFRGASAPRFAEVWDRYTGALSGKPRPAEPSERRALEAVLTASVSRERRRRAAAERARAEADRKARERELRTRTAVSQVRRGGLGARVMSALLDQGPDRDRTPELTDRPGWAWLGIHRRYDEYRAALARSLTTRRPTEAPKAAPAAARQVEVAA